MIDREQEATEKLMGPNEKWKYLTEPHITRDVRSMELSESDIRAALNNQRAVDIAAQLSVQQFPNVETPLILEIVQATFLALLCRPALTHAKKAKKRNE